MLDEAGAIHVSAETAKLLACDAATVSMRHRPASEILDVGHPTPTISPALRRALQARDRRCRPPACWHRRVDAHHIEHWADGRRTAIDNLVLFCRRHHLSVATLTAPRHPAPRRGNGDFTCVMLKGSLPSPFAP